MTCSLAVPVALTLFAAEPNAAHPAPPATAGAPAIRQVRLPAESVPVGTLLELSVDFSARYTNPFDPEDVALDARFTRPSGAVETVPGFYSRDFKRSRRKDGSEKLTPTGGTGWCIRYLPREAGTHHCRVTLRDGNIEVRSSLLTFLVKPADFDGFVRVSRRNPLYFELDSGRPYFAIGENVCWPGKGGTYDYDRYWRKLAENGANYARIWVGPFDCFTLERPSKGKSDPAGLGRIDLEAAWRLDTVLDNAGTRGIRVMFCIESFNSLRIRPMYPRWNGCPYNAANGGPLKKPEDFFTNATARKLFKRRLRYIVARWGWNPAVLSWEFWNEVDIIEKYRSKEVTAWHGEMARYLRGIDPWKHMITTSFARTGGDPAIDGLPEMDYVQSHHYGALDVADNVHRVCLKKTKRFGKPHYFGEFGTDWQAKDTRADTDGIHLHNGLWAAVASGAAGTSMLWWWDNYVEPKDLYYHFKPVAEFVKGIPFNRVRYRPIENVEIRWRGGAPKRIPGTLTLIGKHATWEPAPWNRPKRFAIPRNGEIRDIENLPRVLHGTRNHPKLHNPITFDLDYPKAGEFTVRVNGVSGYGGAGLRITVDGETALERDFPDNEDGGKTLHKYDSPYTVPVSAGKHRIVVSNDGKDWVFVEFRLRNYRVPDRPRLRVFGLIADNAVSDGPTALLWFQNPDSTWYQHKQGEPVVPSPPTVLVLNDVPEGRYRLEWWDTYSGEAHGAGRISSTGERLDISTPEITRDTALKLFRTR